MLRKTGLLLLCLSVLVASSTSAAAPYCAPGQEPEFVLGFAFTKSQLGEIMGDPLECEHANPENGDTLQQTSTGLSFYRKSTNTPTFTDGWRHWGWTAAGMVFWTGDSIDPPPGSEPAAPIPTPTRVPVNPDAPVADLALPFALGDVSIDGGEFVSPFGLVRKSQDRAEIGHGGIDIPLTFEAPIYAVAAGTIVSVEPSVDFRPGSVVSLLIQPGSRDGEGWLFLYEHIDMEPGIQAGFTVARGQLIARNAVATGVSNNHLELTDSFNEYRFYRDKTCWVDRLEAGDRSALVDLFENTIRVSEGFIRGWLTATDGDRYPYRALLDPVL